MSLLTYLPAQPNLPPWRQRTRRWSGFAERSRLRPSPSRPDSKPGCSFDALQRGEKLGMPHSRPMPAIGRRCHELRIVDAGKTWRLIYRLDGDATVIADVFQKTTPQTPARVIADCARRLALYDRLTPED